MACLMVLAQHSPADSEETSADLGKIRRKRSQNSKQIRHE